MTIHTSITAEQFRQMGNIGRSELINGEIVKMPRHTVDVYRRGKKVIHYSMEDVLENEPTLPGFSLKLAELFEPIF